MQVRDYMQAVDATLRPKIEDDYLAPKVRNYRQRSLDVEPIEGLRDLGSSYFTLVSEIDISCRLRRGRSRLWNFGRGSGFWFLAINYFDVSGATCRRESY